MSDWPMMDRTLWPNPRRSDFPWPLEPPFGGWGPGPVATVITSRVCPWRCVFCNEASYIPTMQRKSVEDVIDELNFLDRKFGPIGSVVIHDSMFFQQPGWLREWLDKYPRLARKRWPSWAAGRADTVRRWPDLFEALVRETNWSTISIGFESGSDRMLQVLNKECSAEDNDFTIDLLNRIGDDFKGQVAARAERGEQVAQHGRMTVGGMDDRRDRLVEPAAVYLVQGRVDRPRIARAAWPPSRHGAAGSRQARPMRRRPSPAAREGLLEPPQCPLVMLA